MHIFYKYFQCVLQMFSFINLKLDSGNRVLYFTFFLPHTILIEIDYKFSENIAIFL